jgi:hypothetical protein
MTPIQARLLELLDEVTVAERKARAAEHVEQITAFKKEIYTLRRKLMAITVQRDQWKESSARYRNKLLEKK